MIDNGKDQGNVEDHVAGAHADTTVITVDKLVKSYNGTDVLSGIDLNVQRGEIFGLLGPNGAGKTTTLECVVGLRAPTSGTVRVFGLNPAKARAEITSRVSVQPQSASLFETLTVGETLRLFASFYANPRDWREVIDEVGLSHQGAVRTKHLSGGQNRRLLIGIALMSQPEVVVLDEPSAGLDPAARQNLWGTITGLSAAGTTIVLSTHHMDEATSLCHRVGILVSGKIVALGTPEELIRQRNADTTVSFTVPARTDQKILKGLGPDGAVRIDETSGEWRVHVRTETPDDLVRSIAFNLAIEASDYDIRRGSLEDLFIELADEGSPTNADSDSPEPV
ncbi:ABC transporter ATP-binding protein [Microbacterium sp. MPKO10]|uniref:ABC transporter ATP-binding protein n=1 Tax=Microbacterium sp. MPKO10 TaxID=2989818 RepID=UPI002235D1B9|nr:ABC transporter ATP-binding protein [Microbacterium sp. MPKO10]MCW4458812.1 ABC transporter ATP-binding protein [Microbacterium sp. MPKO10]